MLLYDHSRPEPYTCVDVNDGVYELVHPMVIHCSRQRTAHQMNNVQFVARMTFQGKLQHARVPHDLDTT